MMKIKSIRQYINDLQNKKEGCTQKEIAKFFGLGEQYIGQIKNGSKNMSAKDCLVMAEELKERPEIILITMLHEKEKDIKTKAKLACLVNKMKKKGSN